MFQCRLANVMHTVAYFCADCAGKAKVQTKSLQLCNEENTVNEGKRYGTIKVSVLVKYISSIKVMVLRDMTP
jgi:hypothetical protein